MFSSDMIQQVIPSFESTRTKATLVRASLGVGNHMPFEMAQEIKCFPTMFTSKAFASALTVLGQMLLCIPLADFHLLEAMPST